MTKELFKERPPVQPQIYAYEDTNLQYKDQLKIGYTTVGVQKRVAQQYPTLRPGKLPYCIVLEESAMRSDGSAISDKEVHRYLRKKGFINTEGEWFKCTIKDIKSAIVAIRDGFENDDNRSDDFGLRPEQADAIAKTQDYFSDLRRENPEKTPRFLWNAKMRFGKTFTSYKLAQSMGWTKLLVLTFKPAVQSSWDDDLNGHVDFEGWQFITKKGNEIIDPKKPYVCFGSFQDYLGKNEVGGIKSRNEWVHKTKWDCVIFDEYHYGAWRETAKELFEAEDKKEIAYADGVGMDYFNEDNLSMTIKTNHYLYLSGTPFRAIATGEFIEEQIFNWTYSDEQRAKENWSDSTKPNPYLSLPQMVMMTYQLPDAIIEIAKGGEYNEFDLNVFFSAKDNGATAKFIYENEVQKWLDLIRGSLQETTNDNLKLGAKKPPLPFSDSRLLSNLTHTFWFLPDVASCFAMKNLLMKRQNVFYDDYEIIVAAGSKAGIGVEALPPVLKAMNDPLKSKTITLSCGKLTTGVSVKPWGGILMLRNLTSPETYFQAAFRVQTPWTVKNPDNISPNKEDIIKELCYVFDFAPDRALRQIADYSCRLDVNESNPEKKVDEFIHFLPVLAYDGSTMEAIDAAGILDLAMSGTTATLLARRWESALLVNVDNNTLQKLMNNKAAMDALSNIEGFRSLNQDIETIVNKSESVKKTKAEANDRDLDEKEKKNLTDEEKEYKTLRKQIQEKLIKFATRIPVFMYLTDKRENSLKDVITQLEPDLFKKVTGLGIKDFDLLVGLGVFNSSLMNDAVFKFRRYEEASLSYSGVNKHAGESVGGFDTVLSKDDFSRQVFIAV